MKIVNANAILVNDNQMTMYQKIEKCGRTCYKSEDKITDGSAVKFVGNMLRSGHTAMLEHGHIYMKLPSKISNDFIKTLNDIRTFRTVGDNATKFFDITVLPEFSYVSGSFRTFINLFALPFLPHNAITDTIYAAVSEQYPELFPSKEATVMENAHIEIFKTTDDFVNSVLETDWGLSDILREDVETVKNSIIKKHAVRTIIFTCDRGVSHEFVRHRPCGFAQESTRYCNYSKDKFGKEITVIEPCFWPDHNSPAYHLWKDGCEQAEKSYFALLDAGATPQEARAVLPNSLKTELVITATEEEWQHIVNLRYIGTTGAPHPQMVECMMRAVPLLRTVSHDRIKIVKD